MDRYYTINSGKQIKSIFNSEMRNRFVKTLSNRLGIKFEKVVNIINSSKNDEQIYNKLINSKNLNFRSKEDAFSFRAVKRTEDVSDLFSSLNIDTNFDRYIDVGSDDCLIPVTIADHFDISEVYGCDITDKCITDEIEFVKLTPFVHSKLYKKNNFSTFDLITAFQSLHHIIDRDFRLDEISKLAMIDSIFLVREHDATSNLMKMVIDVEHAMYDVVIDEMPYSEFASNYYADYMSRFELKKLLSDFGFKNIYEGNSFSLTNIYYSVYVKIQ